MFSDFDTASMSAAPRPPEPMTAMFILPLRFCPRRNAGAANDPAAAAMAVRLNWRRVMEDFMGNSGAFGLSDSELCSAQFYHKRAGAVAWTCLMCLSVAA